MMRTIYSSLIGALILLVAIIPVLIMFKDGILI
jgi:hypothetical protein